jgi:hypothetical protein
LTVKIEITKMNPYFAQRNIERNLVWLLQPRLALEIAT